MTTKSTTTVQNDVEDQKSQSKEMITKRFYGLADHPNTNIFTSLLKRRKISMGTMSEVYCKSMESYKACSDKLHKALMFLLVENTALVKNLGVVEYPSKIEKDKPYENAAVFLQGYQKIHKQGRKGSYDDLDPAIKALKKMSEENDRYVKRQLETLKPFTKFIGEDYWEYAKLRKTYWESLVAQENVINMSKNNKEANPAIEKTLQQAEELKEEHKKKMIDFIHKILNTDKQKHVDIIIKFSEDAANFHSTVSDILSTIEAKELRSGMGKVK